MAHYDFREYLQKLAEGGELVEVSAAVNPEFEMGAICQRIAERGGPAAHFKNVEGAGYGLTYVGASMGRGANGLWSKLAIALDAEAGQAYPDLLEELHRRWEAPIRPFQVGSGPIGENVLQGKKIDLNKLTAPQLYPGDDGAYLSTWAVLTAQEPGGGFTAWDIIPLKVTSSDTLTGYLPKNSNLHRIHDLYATANQDMPFAIIFGGPPVVPLVAAFKLKRGDTVAAEIAGGLQRKPLQMVKSVNSDLLVPATAEMVIEGVIKPGETDESGPFSSAFGYRTGKVQTGPVFTVTAISHRNDPILPICTWGTPTSEIHIARGLDSDIQLKAEFEKRGAPVSGVFSPPWLAGAVVAVKTLVPYTAYSQAVAGIVRAREATKFAPYVLVCDTDIDLTNPVSLFHAMVTKCHPNRDTWIIKSSTADENAPYISEAERQLGQGPSAIFDCTWPLDWDRSIAVPPKVSFDECYPQELQDKILEDWTKELRFPDESTRPV
jgi:UbiD family decarboxylase